MDGKKIIVFLDSLVLNMLRRPKKSVYKQLQKAGPYSLTQHEGKVKVYFEVPQHLEQPGQEINCEVALEP